MSADERDLMTRAGTKGLDIIANLVYGKKVVSNLKQ